MTNNGKQKNHLKGSEKLQIIFIYFSEQKKGETTSLYPEVVSRFFFEALLDEALKGFCNPGCGKAERFKKFFRGT